MKKIIFIVLLIFSSITHATSFYVSNTKISVYAQSLTGGSTAHLIRSSVPIYNGGAHPWCGDRAYIDINDKELLSMAMAAWVSGKLIHFQYEDAAPQKVAQGHTTTTCKVLNIFSDPS